MRRKVIFYHFRGFFTLLLAGTLILGSPQLFSQAPSEFHFVYIDVSKIEEFSNLQEQLDTLFNKIKDQKFIFFLSNHNRPVKVTKAKEFKNLLVSISNITTSVPKLETDVENINRIFNENDFLRIDTDQDNFTGRGIKGIYNKIIWHFFFSPMLLDNLNLKKNLIDDLVFINFGNNGSLKPEVDLWFEKEALKTLPAEDILSLKNSGYKIIKY